MLSVAAHSVCVHKDAPLRGLASYLEAVLLRTHAHTQTPTRTYTDVHYAQHGEKNIENWKLQETDRYTQESTGILKAKRNGKEKKGGKYLAVL